MDKIKLKINSVETVSYPDKTILQVAEELGVKIPTLCYDPKTKPYGGCRLCVVEVEGMRAPVPACATFVADGMVVETESARVVRLRKLYIDLLLSNHNADCRDCSGTDSCALREIANEYGVTKSRFTDGFYKMQENEIDDSHPFIIRDRNRCVLCARCVRVCEEVVGMSAITIAKKGFSAYVATPYDSPLQESTCVSCGSCVASCPTGALRFNERILKEYKLDLSSCIYCGLCVESCPHGALETGSDYELTKGDREELYRYHWKKE